VFRRSLNAVGFRLGCAFARDDGLSVDVVAYARVADGRSRARLVAAIRHERQRYPDKAEAMMGNCKGQQFLRVSGL